MTDMKDYRDSLSWFDDSYFHNTRAVWKILQEKKNCQAWLIVVDPTLRLSDGDLPGTNLLPINSISNYAYL